MSTDNRAPDPAFRQNEVVGQLRQRPVVAAPARRTLTPANVVAIPHQQVDPWAQQTVQVAYPLPVQG